MTYKTTLFTTLILCPVLLYNLLSTDSSVLYYKMQRVFLTSLNNDILNKSVHMYDFEIHILTRKLYFTR